MTLSSFVQWYTGFRSQRVKDLKEIARCKRVFVVTEPLIFRNLVKKVRNNSVLIPTELIKAGPSVYIEQKTYHNYNKTW